MIKEKAYAYILCLIYEKMFEINIQD